MELATNGVYVHFPGKAYSRFHQAVNKMLPDTTRRGLAFLLLTRLALEKDLGTAHSGPEEGSAPYHSWGPSEQS